MCLKIDEIGIRETYLRLNCYSIGVLRGRYIDVNYSARIVKGHLLKSLITQMKDENVIMCIPEFRNENPLAFRATLHWISAPLM